MGDLRPTVFGEIAYKLCVVGIFGGQPIHSSRPKRNGKCNEAPDTFVYAHGALHGLISMGLRLNEEVEGPAPERPSVEVGRVIRSEWMA